MASAACRYSTLGQNQGGVVLLRPCRLVAAHMQALAVGDPLLQFRHGHAEQDFLDWCARPHPEIWTIVVGNTVDMSMDVTFLYVRLAT